MTEKKLQRRFCWNEQSIAWYEQAVAHTGYNELLLRLLAPYLRKEDRVCEVACGTGALARSLSPFVAHITANDLDDTALDYLDKKITSNGIRNISICRGDWRQVCTGRQFDVLLFQQFSAFLNDWDILKSTGASSILAILPSAGDAYRGPSNLRDSEQLPVTAKKPMRETWEAVADFLKERDISFEAISFDADFGQPFADLENAFAYYRYYYGDHLTEGELRELADRQLEVTAGGYYLPKHKKLGLIVAHL